MFLLLVILHLSLKFPRCLISPSLCLFSLPWASPLFLCFSPSLCVSVLPSLSASSSLHISSLFSPHLPFASLSSPSVLPLPFLLPPFPFCVSLFVCHYPFLTWPFSTSLSVLLTFPTLSHFSPLCPSSRPLCFFLSLRIFPLHISNHSTCAPPVQSLSALPSIHHSS